MPNSSSPSKPSPKHWSTAASILTKLSKRFVGQRIDSDIWPLFRATEIDEIIQEQQHLELLLMETWDAHGKHAKCSSMENIGCSLCKKIWGDPFYVRNLTNRINASA